MEIINYIKFTEPGEKDKLEQLFKECNSEMELRSKITKTFKVNSIDAGVIAKRCNTMFNNQKQ
jgi:hypothetical protein